MKKSKIQTFCLIIINLTCTDPVVCLPHTSQRDALRLTSVVKWCFKTIIVEESTRLGAV